MSKYGRSNWRAAGVRASIYVDACKRHLDAWFEGEELSPEGVPHLANALACLAILVDAEAHGKLHDDRQYADTKGYRKLVDRLTPFVEEIKRAYADKSPKHWTIYDTKQGPGLPTPAPHVSPGQLELLTEDLHTFLLVGPEAAEVRAIMAHGDGPVRHEYLGRKITHYSTDGATWTKL